MSDLQSLLIAAQRAQSEQRLEDAAGLLQQVVQTAPDHAAAWCNLGMVLRALGRFEDALPALAKAVALMPRHAGMRYNYALAQQQAGLLDAAIASYEEARRLNPGDAATMTNLGIVLTDAGRAAEAIALLRQLLAQRPEFARAWAALGRAEVLAGNATQGVEALRRAVSCDRNLADAWLQLATLQHQRAELNEAEAAYRAGLSAAPRHPELWTQLGNLLLEAKRYDEAAKVLQHGCAIAPAKALAWSQRAVCALKRCDWDDLPTATAGLSSALGSEAQAAPPFDLLGLALSPAQLRDNAQRWCRRHASPPERPAARHGATPKQQLRIAYLSADFRAHATSDLLQEVLDRHDRQQFEVFAYALYPDDGSAERARVAAATTFVDVADQPAQAIARRIADDRIDILIDINVHTAGARPGVPARRPAPVQLAYLGFPGTSGADWYDYAVTDEFISPPARAGDYTERLAYLPGCFQPCDSRRVAGPRPTRAACGLRDDAFVYACFNANWKWTPPVFDSWLQVLQAVPNAVLWLLMPEDPTAVGRLSHRALLAGVDPARLVWAPRVARPENLARQALADLFLDTLPCNAHTTANDALFAGLPVLTCAGEAFHERVAGSLLHALGLDELVTRSLEDYRAAAITLAHTPGKLAALRCRLESARHGDVFDMAAYTRRWESLLQRIWALKAAGGDLPPILSIT